jgi:hypothetical protein
MELSLDLQKQRDEQFLIHDQWAMKHANLAVKDAWNKILDKYQNEIPPESRPRKIQDGGQLPKAPAPVPLKHRPEKDRLQFKVGVIGAGAAGLFVGMILDWLSEQAGGSIKFEYDIHEASDRVGGRIYTHKFTGQGGPHDYYDVGAMRFPDNPIMNRYAA